MDQNVTIIILKPQIEKCSKRTKPVKQRKEKGRKVWKIQRNREEMGVIVIGYRKKIMELNYCKFINDFEKKF